MFVFVRGRANYGVVLHWIRLTDLQPLGGVIPSPLSRPATYGTVTTRANTLIVNMSRTAAEVVAATESRGGGGNARRGDDHDGANSVRIYQQVPLPGTRVL